MNRRFSPSLGLGMLATLLGGCAANSPGTYRGTPLQDGPLAASRHRLTEEGSEQLLALEDYVEEHTSRLLAVPLDFPSPRVLHQSYKVRMYDRTTHSWAAFGLPPSFLSLDRFTIKYLCDHVGPEHASDALRSARIPSLAAIITAYMNEELTATNARSLLHAQDALLYDELDLSLADATANSEHYDSSIYRTSGETHCTPLSSTIYLDSELLARGHLNRILDTYAHEEVHAFINESLGIIGNTLFFLTGETEEQQRIEETSADVFAQWFCDTQGHTTHENTLELPACTDDFNTGLSRLHALYRARHTISFCATDLLCTRYSEHENPADPTSLAAKICTIAHTIGMAEHLRLVPSYDSLHELDRAYQACIKNPHLTLDEFEAILDED